MSNLTHWRQREIRSAWFMSAPALVALTIFVALPLIMALYLSLTDKRLVSPLPTEFVGLKNYANLLSVKTIDLAPLRDEQTGEIRRDDQGKPLYPTARSLLRGDPAYSGYQEWFSTDINGHHFVVVAKDPTFLQSIVNTVFFAVVIVPVQGGLALLLALLVNQKLKGINLFRTIYFTPVVTSIAVLSVVWIFLYNPDQGLINRFIEIITVGQVKSTPWLIAPQTAMPAIIILCAWQGAGFQMIIFLAGLQGIPEMLYEAAQIDGANTLQQFLFITVPQLRNTIVFVIIGTTILAFRLFTPVDIMTKGGPKNATVTLVYEAIEQGFRQQQIGYASAITIIFFIIVLIIALLQRVLVRSQREIE